MTEPTDANRRFPDAREDLERWDRQPDTAQTRSPSYRLAFSDGEFLTRDELRPVRLQLELLKVEMALAERGIRSTIVMLGIGPHPRPGAGGGRGSGPRPARALLRRGARVRPARDRAGARHRQHARG